MEIIRKRRCVSRFNIAEEVGTPSYRKRRVNHPPRTIHPAPKLDATSGQDLSARLFHINENANKDMFFTNIVDFASPDDKCNLHTMGNDPNWSDDHIKIVGVSSGKDIDFVSRTAVWRNSNTLLAFCLIRGRKYFTRRQYHRFMGAFRSILLNAPCRTFPHYTTLQKYT